MPRGRSAGVDLTVTAATHAASTQQDDEIIIAFLTPLFSQRLTPEDRQIVRDLCIRDGVHHIARSHYWRACSFTQARASAHTCRHRGNAVWESTQVVREGLTPNTPCE